MMKATSVETNFSRADERSGGGSPLLLNVLLVAFSLGVSLVLMEGAVRLVAPQLTYRFPRDLFVPDPAVSYRLRPGFEGTTHTPEYRTDMRITGQGLRDEREYGPKPADVTRVLAIGDSFTMGVGVDSARTLVKQVQSLLNADGRTRRVEILNGGVAGYSTNQEATFLETYGLAFQPDLVVLGFFIGNDIGENAGEPLAVHDGYLGNAHETQTGLLPVSVRRFLGLHSQLYHLLWPIQRRLLGNGREEERREAIERGEPYGGDPKTHDKTWGPTFAALERIATISREHHVPVVVVLIPESMQSVPVEWSAFVDSTGNPATAYQPEAPNKLLAKFCADHGLLVHDLLPAFRSNSAASMLYFRLDHHWTEAGNELAAASLHPFLREQLNRAGL